MKYLLQEQDPLLKGNDVHFQSINNQLVSLVGKLVRNRRGRCMWVRHGGYQFLEKPACKNNPHRRMFGKNRHAFVRQKFGRVCFCWFPLLKGKGTSYRKMNGKKTQNTGHCYELMRFVGEGQATKFGMWWVAPVNRSARVCDWALWSSTNKIEDTGVGSLLSCADKLFSF